MAKKQIIDKKNFMIHDELYGVYLEVLIGGTVNDLVNIAKEKYKITDIDYGENLGGWFAFDEDSSVAFIWLAKLSQEIQDVGYLVHETQHATFDILYSRGLKHCSKSAEAFTYYQQYLVTQIIGKYLE